MSALATSRSTRAFRLLIPGEPQGKGRPRYRRGGGIYTPAQTLDAEENIRNLWLIYGRPRLPDGPLEAEIVLMHARPQSHLLTDGSLSAEGQRTSVPVRKPDLDNAVKLILDALNGEAYRDDSQFCRIVVTRMWSPTGDPATTVRIREFRA